MPFDGPALVDRRRREREVIFRVRAPDLKAVILDEYLAGVVMANRAALIANRVFRHRQLFGVRPASLDEPLPGGDGATRRGLNPASTKPMQAFGRTNSEIKVQRPTVLACNAIYTTRLAN